MLGALSLVWLLACALVSSTEDVSTAKTALGANKGRVCSSLDGPNCLFVNGREPPAHGFSPSSSSSPDLLDGLLDGNRIFDISSKNKAGGFSATSVAKAIREFLRKLEGGRKPRGGGNEKSIVHGSFALKGEYIQKLNSLQLQAVQWKSRPGPNWIMVGLYGGHNRFPPNPELKVRQRSQALVLTITDPDTGEPLSCSKMLLFRVRKGLRRTSLFEGEWKGTYACLGSRNQAHLTIVTHPTSIKNRGPVSAILRFTSESFPGRDSTLAGCRCLERWNYEGSMYVDGECGMVGSDRPWCFIEDGTCSQTPAGLNWDYCAHVREEIHADKKGTKSARKIEVVFRFDENGQLVQVNDDDVQRADDANAEQQDGDSGEEADERKATV